MNKRSRKERSVEAWEVYQNGYLIDLVYGRNFTAIRMKQALVEDDGYSPAITVKPIYPEFFKE